MIILPLFNKSPSRREILGGVVVAAVGLLIPPIALAQPEIYPYIAELLRKRLAGQQSRFDCKHFCKECQRVYLCPDRFDRDFCAPSKEYQRMWGIDCYNYYCFPCMAKLDTANSSAWWEAHGVNYRVAD